MSVEGVSTQPNYMHALMQAGYHGVPVVGMPLFAEQPDNIMRAVDRGFALSVSAQKPKTLAADLEKALKRVLHEPSFAVNAAKVSRQMRSRRWSPAEIAASTLCSMLLLVLTAQNPFAAMASDHVL